MTAFELPSRWRVDAPREAVFDALTDGSITTWWHEVYLDVTVVEEGDPSGTGRVVDLLTRGWLPYRLRWRMRVEDIVRPERIAISATGDLVGSGCWTLTAHGPGGTATRLDYLWRVDVSRPWMRQALVVLKPVFAANHGWAMTRGERGLRAHLAATPATARA
jgi:uncharacterized protein YndB with AHSA1/START domain